MGAVISDLLEASDLVGEKAEAVKTRHNNGQHNKLIENVADRSSRRRSRMPACTRGHHRLCRRAQKVPITFGERLERIYALGDSSMMQRSSTPTAVLNRGELDQLEMYGEDEYGAWTAYLRTPGTFRGQLVPDLPGAFSGMCFPGTDPRWICHHQTEQSTAAAGAATGSNITSNVVVAVQGIVAV